MPGIAGIVGVGSDEQHREMLRVMLHAMHHSTVMEAGQAIAPDLGVWAGWTAFPGSFAAKVCSLRPVDGSVVLFAGECFSRQLDSHTAAIGSLDARFAQSLIGGCRADARQHLQGLNGLFSGLVIDRSARESHLFNDRFGVERLYCAESGERLLFASEAKALLAVDPALRSLCPEDVGQFLKYGSVLGGRTLFSGVSLIPGGSHWLVNPLGEVSRRRYFSSSEWEAAQPLHRRAYQQSLCDTLRAVVPCYLEGGQGVGVAVTGGLDTRMIMATLPDMPKPTHCYTYDGVASETLDTRIGRKVARICGLAHDVLRIGPNFLRDFSDHVDQTVFVTDGSAGPLEAHEIYFSRLAAKFGQVRLTGNYGSEILRGVSTLKALNLHPQLLSSSILPCYQSAVFESQAAHPASRAAFEEIPWHLHGTLSAAKSVLTVRTPFLDNDVVRLAVHSPASESTSLRAGFQVVSKCKLPLGAIPTDRGLRPDGRNPIVGRVRRLNAYASFKLDYWHKEGLPVTLRHFGPALDLFAGLGLLGRHKYLPYRAWFRNELRPYVLDVVFDPHANRNSLWNSEGIKRVVADHVGGRRNCIREIHFILAMEAIDRLLLRAPVALRADPNYSVPV